MGKNRIVVDYGDTRDLVLLTVVDVETGEELPYNTMVHYYSDTFSIVKKYNFGRIPNLLTLKELEYENKEGFVIKFNNGLRIKVKFTEYCRLHGILTNVSTKTIWEYLSNDLNMDELLEKVPDEFYKWLNSVIHVLKSNFSDIETQALKEFVRIYRNEGKSRKETICRRSQENYWFTCNFV